MGTSLKYYGNICEISTIEKTPKKVRLQHSRKKRVMYSARRSDSLRRTKGICLRRLLSAIKEFGSPLMLSLTFEGTASDLKYATESLSRFQRRLRAKYPDCQSLFIPELSPGYRIHFHGLLFNVPNELGDVRIGRRTISNGIERSTRELARLWGEGFVDCQQTDGDERLAYYLSKYITKTLGNAFFAPVRLVRVSNGFPKELVIREGDIRSQDFLQLIRSYSQKVPDHEYETYSVFLGKISKKKYRVDL